MSRKKKPWVKLDAEEPIRMLAAGWTLAELGAYISLKGMTNMSQTYDVSVISYGHSVRQIGPTDQQFCKILDISVRQWQRYKQRLNDGKLIEILPNNCIKLIPYTNQKPVRPMTNTAQQNDISVIPDTDTYTDTEPGAKKGAELLKQLGIHGPDGPDASNNDQPENTTGNNCTIEPF